METLLKDLRFAARALGREPGSALVSVLVLALGIGLSTFMFSLVYGVFFRGLGLPEEDRIALVRGFETRAGDPEQELSLSGADYRDYLERARSFEGLAAYSGGTVNVSGVEGPERYSGAFVTANTFDVLRVVPALGRTFVPEEGAPGAPPAVLLGWSVWQTRYGGDPGILGRSIRVNGETAPVVGVLPEGFRWPSNHDLWVSTDEPLSTDVPGGSWTVVGRLAPGVSWAQADEEVAGIAAQLARERPEENEDRSARLWTYVQSQNGGEIQLIFTAMMVAVLCVLLVACANVANLLLARATLRAREAGVRAALGAGRLRVMVPFLAEALVLAAVGAAAGTALAYGAVDLFDQATVSARTGRPYFVLFRIDLPILLFVVGLTVLTALAAGIAPAVQVARADVNRILKDEGRGSSSFHMGRLSRVLVVAEVALSCALLVGAGLMTKSIARVASHEFPFEPGVYLTGRMGLFEADYPDRDARQAFWRDVDERVRSLPGVSVAALASGLPGASAGGAALRIEGRTYDEPSDRPISHVMTVTPAFFELMDARVLEGEPFTDLHDGTVDRVAVVNRSFVDRHWPGESALGRRFRTGTSDTIPWITVIGVVPDLAMEGFAPQGSPQSTPDGYYVPVTQSDPSFLNVLVRPAAGAPVALAPALRDAVRSLDPDLPVYDVRTLQEAIDRSGWFFSVFGVVFIVFGVAALFMASVGLYGVLAFWVSRRTQEMGIRMALGAEGAHVRRLVLRQAALQLGFGLALGLAMAWGVSRLVAFLMFQVDPQDPLVFGGVVAVIAAVALVGSLVPARRATSVDPVVALRSS